MKSLKAWLLCFLFLPSFGLAQEEVPYDRLENRVYALTDGVGLVMDVFTPKGEKNGLAIIDVLSGAWFSEQGQVNDHIKGQMFNIYCSRGYTVFMVRPGSRTLFTAEGMVDHIQKGIAYIKDHAQEFGIDPDRIGITGASAGGHLTLMTLVAVNSNPDLKLKTGAVFFPPTDFIDYGGKTASFERIGDILFSGGVEGHSEEEVKKKAEELSPALQVKEALPPVLLIHGDADPAVPLQQSEKMLKVLEEAGGQAKLIVKPGGGHPWPTIPEEVALMADWFDEHLKN
jgi:dipeptidyl aminopeptidase/acylaminoacyl peptidase